VKLTDALLDTLVNVLPVCLRKYPPDFTLSTLAVGEFRVSKSNSTGFKNMAFTKDTMTAI
jgi:hypothetical protein